MAVDAAPGSKDAAGVHLNTADCDCAQCNGDLWLSAVVSPAAPGVAVCPEHADVSGCLSACPPAVALPPGCCTEVGQILWCVGMLGCPSACRCLPACLPATSSYGISCHALPVQALVRRHGCPRDSLLLLFRHSPQELDALVAAAEQRVEGAAEAIAAAKQRRQRTAAGRVQAVPVGVCIMHPPAVLCCAVLCCAVLCCRACLPALGTLRGPTVGGIAMLTDPVAAPPVPCCRPHVQYCASGAASWRASPASRR